MEIDFYRAIDKLEKTKNKREANSQILKLKEYVFSRGSSFFIYRLAIILDRKQIDIGDLEDQLIKLGNPHYLTSLALYSKSANINKLLEGVIKSNDVSEIANFACSVRGVNPKKLEDLIAGSQTPKAAYIYLRFCDGVDVEKFRSCILKSKKPRYLYLLATKTTDQSQLEEIERLILNSKSFYYMRLLYKNILKDGDISQLVQKVLLSGLNNEIKKTYLTTKSTRLAKYIMLI